MGKSRYPELKFKDGKMVCRGCGSEIPQGRQTWCSTKCFDSFQPHLIGRQVRARDKGICQICNRDISELANEWLKANPSPKREEGAFWPSPEFKTWESAYKKWESSCPREEHDHIIPFSKGGKTILENLRTVCSPCHKKTDTYGIKAKKWKPEPTSTPPS